jgi:outer membrane receptor protein involved in Fe transport
MNLLCRIILIGSTAILVALPGLTVAKDPPPATVMLHIGAAPIGDALNEFAKQSGLQVVLYSELAQGLTAPALEGTFTPRDALDRLLARTNLAYEFINPRTVAVRQKAGGSAKDTDPEGRAGAHPTSQLESSTDGRITLAQAGTPSSGAGELSRSPAADDASGSRTSGDTAQLQEVIVTSTRREESLQKVPASVSAVSGADLESRGLTDFEAVAPTIPSLSFTTTGEGHGSDRTIAIRGVSSGGAVNVGETTGFYLDDTPIPFAVDPNFFDIERVEVLRGPQGTLYGARSMGGTVRIITNSADPSGESGRIMLDGSDVDGGGFGYTETGAVNIPLVTDTSALRLSMFDSMTPGTQNKLVTSTDSLYRHVDDSRTWGALASGIWKLGDDWELSPKFMHQESFYNGLPFADYQPDDTLQIRSQNVSEAGNDQWTLASLTVRKHLQAGEIVATASRFDRSFLDREDGSEFMQLIAQTAFDSTFSGASPASKYQTERIWTYEARFVSGWRGPAQLVSGVYYQDRDKVRDFRITAPGFGAATATGTDLIFDGGDNTDEKEFALYGEGTLNLSPQWQLTLGARWSDAHINLDRATGGLFGGQTLNQSTPNSTTTPKAAVTFAPRDDVHLYVSASEGYRLGGVNFTIPSATSCASPSDAEAYQALHTGPTFNPDKLWNYEIGAKTELFDHKVRINAAVFDMEWKDIQQNVSVCGFNLTVNAGDARTTGGEIEVTARVLPTLTVNLNASRLRANLTQAVPDIASDGARILGIPDWQVSTYLDWSVPVIPNWSAFVRPQITYNGSEVFTFHPTANADLTQGGTTQYDLRVGMSNRQWEFAFYGANLSDVRRSLGPDVSLLAELPGRPRLGVNAARTIGIRAAWSF